MRGFAFVAGRLTVLALVAAGCDGNTLYDDEPTDPPPGAQPVPSIVLTGGPATFAALQGVNDVAPRTFAISNGTTGTALVGLTASVGYEGVGGWLDVMLTTTRAPAELVLRPRMESLPPGTHRASVRVSAPEAANSPIITATATVRGIDLAELAATINSYRLSQGLAAIPLSVSMTRVAEAHVRDLELHSPHGGICNGHSWSSHGNWTACC